MSTVITIEELLAIPLFQGSQYIDQLTFDDVLSECKSHMDDFGHRVSKLPEYSNDLLATFFMEKLQEAGYHIVKKE